MKKLPILSAALLAFASPAFAEKPTQIEPENTPVKMATKPTPALVSYSGFQVMTKEVADHRAKRLITLDQFNKMSAEKNTIILDTRSAHSFKGLHMKGATHMNFSDFTKEKLEKLIPDKNTRILIYCNNNFKDNPATMMMKMRPLALNIPTYINLYGYGYQNVYELSEHLSINDNRIKLGGTIAAKYAKKVSPDRAITPAEVDYQGFTKLIEKFAPEREKRLISLDKFNEMSKEPNTIILDTRSAKAFKGIHLTNAVHLNFSDFTQQKLSKVIPDKNTRILIYCNNNIKADPEKIPEFQPKGSSLALNIPTNINLNGYGYKNVFELKVLVPINDSRLSLTGTKVPSITKPVK